MTKVRIYQITDSCSESVISTFVAPNIRYAIREFKKFLTDPKIKDNIDPSDFDLVCSSEVEIAQSHDDAAKLGFVEDGYNLLNGSLLHSEDSDEA